MPTKATMIEPLPILTRRSDSTPTMLSPFAIEEERNGISTTRAVMRISRKRGSWMLQFADEKQNLRYRSAPVWGGSIDRRNAIHLSYSHRSVVRRSPPTRSASLPGPQKHPAYGALHRAIAVAAQGFLADLNGSFVRLLCKPIVQIYLDAQLLRLMGELLEPESLETSFCGGCGLNFSLAGGRWVVMPV